MLTSQHRMAPSIVVVPRIDTPASLDTECVNGGPGQPQTDTWLAHDLPAWTVNHFRVERKRTSWATVGYSYGAWCAASLAMRHPDVFGAAVVLLGYFRPDFSAAYDPLSTDGLRNYDLVALARNGAAARGDVGADLPGGPAVVPDDVEVPQRRPAARSTSPPPSSPTAATATRCSPRTSRTPWPGWPRPCPGFRA